MMSQGFARSKCDHCVYFKTLNDEKFLILVLYVDDMLIASHGMSDIDVLKTQLSGTFEMKDLGAVNRVLGIDIHRDRKRSRLWLSQEEYLEKVLKKYEMDKSKPVSVPHAAHFKLSSEHYPKTDEEKHVMSHVPYSSIVGSLMYVMVYTRPDISQAMRVVSRFMSNPGKQHCEAMKWLLRYIRGTQDYVLTFEKSKDKLVGYVDSDYAGSVDNRRSTLGYSFVLAGGAIS